MKWANKKALISFASKLIPSITDPPKLNNCSAMPAKLTNFRLESQSFIRRVGQGHDVFGH